MKQKSRAMHAKALTWLNHHITTKEYAENLRHTFFAWHRTNATRVPVNNENPVLGQMYRDMTGDWFCHVVNTELITTLRMMLENANRTDYAWTVEGFGVHISLMYSRNHDVEFVVAVTPHKDNNLLPYKSWLTPPADLDVEKYNKTLGRV